MNYADLQDWFIDRMSSIEGARDHLPPKKLVLLPPKREAPEPPNTGTRIKFTTKRKSEPGITVDEEARRRQHALVEAASQAPISRTASPMKTATPDTNGLQPELESENEPSEPEPTEPKVEDEPVQESAVQPVRPQPQVQVNTVFETTTRPAGKGEYPSSTCRSNFSGYWDSLYEGLVMHTDDRADLDKPFVRCFRASAELTQQNTIITLLERQAKFRVVTAVRPFVLRREAHRVILSFNGDIIEPSNAWDDGAFEWFVTVPLGVHIVKLDVMCHLNDKGEPAPIWPEERFEYESHRVTFHVVPDWHIFPDIA